MTSTVRKRCRIAAMSAARLGSEPGRLMTVSAVPKVGSAFRLEALEATPSPTMVAAMATMSSARTSA